MKTGGLIFIFMLFCVFQISAQVTIGSEKPPEEFSSLELDSDEGGLRLNQLNATQKNSLTSLLTSLNKETAKGLTIYDLETKTIQYWSGSEWIQVVGSVGMGTEGQFLKSNGADQFPEWVTLKIPEIKQGDYYLHSSVVVKDNQGVVIGDKAEDMSQYQLNDPLTADWVVLPGLTATIDIPDITGAVSGKEPTRVAVQLQAGGQIATGVRPQTWNNVGRRNGSVTTYDVKVQNIITPTVLFAIGIFVGNDIDGYKLKIARPTRIEASGGGMSFSLFTVMGTISDLVAGQYIIKVAVRRRKSENMEDGYPWPGSVFPEANKRFSFGAGIPEAGNVNPFMTQSSLKVNVYALNTGE